MPPRCLPSAIVALALAAGAEARLPTSMNAEALKISRALAAAEVSPGLAWEGAGQGQLALCAGSAPALGGCEGPHALGKSRANGRARAKRLGAPA